VRRGPVVQGGQGGEEGWLIEKTGGSGGCSLTNGGAVRVKSRAGRHPPVAGGGQEGGVGGARAAGEEERKLGGRRGCGGGGDHFKLAHRGGGRPVGGGGVPRGGQGARERGREGGSRPTSERERRGATMSRNRPNRGGG
jgi:hypothetical protein